MNQFVNGIFVVVLMSMALMLPHSEAALAQGIFNNAAHPGKCYISPTLILSSGESAKYPDMECARIICGNNSHGEIQTCGVMGPPPGCKLGDPKFPDADYPECCDRDFICSQ